MFISVVKDGHGGKNQYVLLKESYRTPDGKNRSRVVHNFGNLAKLLEKDPNALENLKAQYVAKTEQKRAANSAAKFQALSEVLTATLQNYEDGDEHPITSLFYGHAPLRRIWMQDLQLDRKIRMLQAEGRTKFDMNAAIFFQTFLKILDPSSIHFAFGHKDLFIGDPAADLELNNLYESLDFLANNKDDLFCWVNRRLDGQFGKNRASLIFYDVTNTYFETPLTDAERGYEQVDFEDQLLDAVQRAVANGELSADCFDEAGMLVPGNLPQDFLKSVAEQKIQYLRMRGPSKEHRFDLPLASIALVIDQHGNPMDFQVFAGNASEMKTMRRSIEYLMAKYAINDAVIVADRGLNSVENLKMLRDQELGFLVAQKVSQFDAALRQKMFDAKEYTALDPEDPDAFRYRVIPNWTKKGTKGDIDCTLVLTYSEKRRKRDLALLETWREIVLAKKAAGAKFQPKKFGWSSLAKFEGSGESLITGINEKAYERKKELCGYAAIVYEDGRERRAEREGLQDPDSLKRLGARVTASYSRLNRIEDAFRVMKSNLGLRPMYVWNSNHIRGHVTLCVLALLVLRLLEHRLTEAGTPMSTNAICRTLCGAKVAAMKNPAGDLMFLHVSNTANVRLGRETWKTEECLEYYEAHKEEFRPRIAEIMRACGLAPLPRFTNRHELARCLGTRYGSDTEVVAPLQYCLL